MTMIFATSSSFVNVILLGPRVVVLQVVALLVVLLRWLGPSIHSGTLASLVSTALVLLNDELV
jgi:hypothetical protein